MSTAAPQHGICQKNRRLVSSGGPPLGTPCGARAVAGSIYCAPHRTEALQRLPDRSIGDNRPLRWSAWTYMSRGS